MAVAPRLSVTVTTTLNGLPVLVVGVPVIDPVAFPNTEPWYFWASSPTIAPIYAWVVNFQGGGWYQAGANNYERVRCVR